MTARRIIRTWLVVAATSALALAATASASGLTTLRPGESAMVATGTATPPLPPKLDLVLLMDTTGSMGGEVSNIQSSAASLFDTIRADSADSSFAVAGFEDYPVSPYGVTNDLPYYLLQDLTADKTGWQTGVNALTVVIGSGNDIPESQVPALYALSTGSGLAWTGGSTPGGQGISFRANAAHVVVLASDASFHNDKDGNHAYAGFTTPTYAEALAGLADDGSRVIAIDSGTAPDPPTGTGSHADMTAIATDTGGTRRTIPDNGTGLSTELLSALDALTYDVTSVVTCDPLEVELDPESFMAVAPETPLAQNATITVPEDVSAGELPTDAPLECAIQYVWGDVATNAVVEEVQVVLPSAIEVEGGTTKRRLKASATLTPGHDEGVTIALERKKPSGFALIEEKEAMLKPSGDWFAKFDRPRPGKCRVVASFAGDTGHDPSEGRDKLGC